MYMNDVECRSSLLQKGVHSRDLRPEATEEVTEATFERNNDKLITLVGLEPLHLRSPWAGRKNGELMTGAGQFGRQGDQPWSGVFSGPDGVRSEPEYFQGRIHFEAMMVMRMG
jgi:hypothetical protein